MISAYTVSENLESTIGYDHYRCADDISWYDTPAHGYAKNHGYNNLLIVGLKAHF